MSQNPLDDLASLDEVDRRGPINWKKRVRLFAIINLVLAVAMGVENVVQVVDAGTLISSLGMSQISSDAFGAQTLWSLRGILATVVYLAAGLSLLKEWRWGYYAHVVGCVITTVLGTPICCVFIPWTIWGLNWGSQPEFREILEGDRDRLVEEPFVD